MINKTSHKLGHHNAKDKDATRSCQRTIDGVLLPMVRTHTRACGVHNISIKALGAHAEVHQSACFILWPLRIGYELRLQVTFIRSRTCRSSSVAPTMLINFSCQRFPLLVEGQPDALRLFIFDVTYTVKRASSARDRLLHVDASNVTTCCC